LVEICNSLEQLSKVSESAPEAPYQLAATSFLGLSAEPDVDKSLRSLESAVLRGYKKAIRTAMNVYQGLGRDPPVQVKSVCENKLEEMAHDELVQLSPFDRYSGRILLEERYYATKRWRSENSVAYDEFVQPVNFSSLVPHSSLWPSMFAAQNLQRTTSDGSLFSASNLKHLQTSQNHRNSSDDIEIRILIEEIRDNGCVNTPIEPFCLTPLKMAIASNDLPLTQILVEQLGASINECGGLLGQTPLWMACSLGHFDVAMYLVKHGADVACRDSWKGTTILHMVSQFRKVEEIEAIINLGLGAGISINELCDDGHTPLAWTFCGWDFSQGKAAQVLLCHGADCTLGSLNALLLCAARLDWELLQEMVTAYAKIHGPDELANNRHWLQTKANIFPPLMSLTRFQHLESVGRKYNVALRKVVEILVPDNTVSMQIFQELLPETNNTLLHYACYQNRGDILETILNIETHGIDINKRNQWDWTALEIAIKHRDRFSARMLLQHGTDIWNPWPRLEWTVVHFAAAYFPELLNELIAEIEKIPLRRRNGKSTRDIIQTADKIGSTAFDLAVMEGSAEHLRHAEELRVAYNLDHDEKLGSRGIKGEKLTLAGTLIACAAIGIPVLWEKYEYILSLYPSFKCGQNHTLLTRALGPRKLSWLLTPSSVSSSS
jgi:ankyrin repeat protein